MPRYLLIVARDRTSLYEELEAMYRRSDRIQVVLDRRGGPDRCRDSSTMRSGADHRRLRPDVEERLRSVGWVIVDSASGTRR